MLSAHFLRKIHSIMTNCKFVIGNEVKHLGCAHVDVYEILHYVQDDKMKANFCFDTLSKQNTPLKGL